MDQQSQFGVVKAWYKVLLNKDNQQAISLFVIPSEVVPPDIP